MSHLGNTYSLPRHGFARRNTFEYIKDRQQLIFRLQSDQDTRSVYPWDFTLEIGYKLDDQKLLISYTVLNSSSNAANPMLFTIGSHPAFRLPLNDLSIDQFSIRFSDQEQLQRFPLDNNGLLKESRESFALDDGAIVLQNDTFADDALVFKNINSAAISLWQGSKERVRVDTGGAPHLGLWAKPGAAYVCIEPWFGYSDSQNSTGLFKDKPELKSLAPGESFHTQWGIELPSI